MVNLHQIRTRRDSVERLENIFQFVSRHYSGDRPLNELRFAAANGYLSGIDPHTLVFTPENFEEFEVHIKGKIYGVGMMVGTNEHGKLQVKQVLKDTPAARAGFQKNDIIAKIGDESTINMTVMEAVQRIRGPKDSEIVLTVKRETKDEEAGETPRDHRAVPVRRDSVEIKSVESTLLSDWDPENEAARKGAVGYIKVTNFAENTTPSLRRQPRPVARIERRKRPRGPHPPTSEATPADSSLKRCG